MNERVTWLLPVKDGMPYLPQTLASIESQTYKNWEILVWDNGSTDGTVEEMKKWIPSRLPGRVVSGFPLPLGECLAEMVRQANTEFCARIDADDVNLPERLEKQVEFLLNNSDIAVLGSRVSCIDSNGSKLNRPLFCPLNHDEIVDFMLRICAISHPSVLFRRSAVLEAGNYRDVFVNGVRQPCEDYDLWLRMATRFKFTNLDCQLLNYRVHDNSTTQTSCTGDTATKVLDDCLCRNATPLYGCAEKDAQLLREWLHPDPIKVLVKIAEYLDITQGSNVSARLSSQSFMEVGRAMISPKDIYSRLRWVALDRGKLAILKELAFLGTKGISKALNFLSMLVLQNSSAS